MFQELTARVFSTTIAVLYMWLATPCHAQQWLPVKAKGAIRVATYNVSLNRPVAGKLADDLRGGDAQAKAVAAVIRAVRPDILLLNEIDYEPSGKNGGNASLFASRYLAVETEDSLGGGACSMPYVYSAPVNTGVPSEMDLNG
ncbi:MAG: endonuclease/exonuclease/phosphatase family protein, partial [Planctomycetota bacterium]